jgi:hypothetical protein
MSLVPSGGIYSSGSFTNVQVSELFGPETDNGTNFFSGGRTSVNIGQLGTPEITAIMQCYRNGLNRIKKICPAVYNDLISQQSPDLTVNSVTGAYDNSWQNSGKAAALKFAMIAKGTLASTGGTKPITWPPSVGQIGVAWLDPFLVRYSNAATSTYPAYTSYGADSWNIAYPTTLGSNLVYPLGSATYTKNTPPGTSSTLASQSYYQASGALNQHELFFVFQNGILEVGSTPDIQQWILQTTLTQSYSVYTTDALVTQPVDNYRLLYQYNTPGILPVYFDMGTLWGGLAETTITSHTNPLLGMAFYETGLFGTTGAGAPQFI